MLLRAISCGTAAMALALAFVAPAITSASRGSRQDQSARPWPPPRVAQVPEESPALTPDEALKTFVMPPGYRVELVASEPMIQDPIWLDMDPEGRLWIVEMRGFMPNAAGENERAPVGRINVLEDTDDDGRMDRSTIFLDGLVLPRSVKVLDRGVLVAEPPHLWLARDADGDLRADGKEAIRSDYGRAEGNPEHNANGLLWALDNWIYTSEHDGHLRLRHGAWEHQDTLMRGQWGLSMDDVGRVYRNWNEAPIYVDLFPARYFMRNPHMVRTRGVYELLMEQKDMVVWPVRPTRGVNRGYRDGFLRPDGSLTTYSSAGTPTVYRGDRLPAELYGNVFVTEPGGNLVHRIIVTEDAAGRLRARNAYPRGEFLASTDERFRPVNLFSAPDGTLYVVDMYRGIIQHGAYQSEYLKHHIQARRLDQPIGLGRIYRVVHESTRRDRKPALSKLSAAALVDLLAHPNGWWRDTAQRLLVERGDRAIVPVLRERLTPSQTNAERTRLHALWTLDGLEAIEEQDVRRALTDPSAYVRAAAVRLAEPWLRQANHALHEPILKTLDDPSPVVRRQLALSLGELPEEARERPLGDLLLRDAADPILVDAVVSSLRGQEAIVLERLSSEGSRAADRGDAITMLAAAVTAAGNAEAIERLIDSAAQAARLPAQRVAMLRGIELGLPGRDPTFGASALGSSPIAALAAAGPGLGGGGGRDGGLLGAIAAVGEGGGRRGPTRITLPRRPAALLALQQSPHRGTAALARRIGGLLEWPGKPSTGREAAPLTADEQKRFTNGQQVFQNLCAACHQADGRGQAGLGPALVGSKWVLGRAGLAARIILSGKEGEKMMPPLSMLTDEQVAAVLTYVRRSWGHTASPVDADLVREVRGASTGRTRPWTEAELGRVTQPDGPPRIPR